MNITLEALSAGNWLKVCGLSVSEEQKGTPKGEEIFSENLSPWITPLLVHPDERGNRYGKMLLDHARTEAGRMGYKTVYLTTGEINYYEKYGFREVGLTCFTWGRPTKIYNAETKIYG